MINQEIKELDGIALLPLGVLLEDKTTLVISDLHIGFEALLRREGVQLPRSSYREMREEVERYIALSNITSIVLNGDVKEHLASLSYQENTELEDFLDFLQKRVKVVFVRGNHDNFVVPLLHANRVEFHEKYVEIGDNFITHGHMKLEDEIKSSKASRIIIGHEHASILIRDESTASHKFKVIAEASVWGKKVYVLPAFSPLKPGCELNLRRQEFLSPILGGATNFIYHLYEDGEWFEFKHKDVMI